MSYGCEVYYIVNGSKQFNKFEIAVPQNFDFYQIEDKNIPGNLFNLLMINTQYKLCRDDGPALSYDINTEDERNYWISSKCKIYLLNNHLYLFELNNGNIFTWTKNTNHLMCKNCKKFCKQKCFI